jgi:3,4-dihydroxy 2-butanone 4-phosphate synthase / GTP cyclohydrolase II
MSLGRIEDAVAAVARGEMVVVVDDVDRENEGDLIMAAEKVTAAAIAFMVRHTSGVICAPLTGERLDALEVGLMVPSNTESQRTAFTVTVDARHGTTTGISAADRAATIRALVDPATRPADLARPGHIFPLRARPGGVLARPGHTEAAVDLARLAGLTPAGVLAEVINDDGTMARMPELEQFAAEHGLVLISIADLAAYRCQVETSPPISSRGRSPVPSPVKLPTPYGDFDARVWRTGDGAPHLALVYGAVGDELGPALVRIHSECLTGDVFGSLRCDCGAQLEHALEQVAEAGRGVVLYLRGHEGRGIGLAHKLRAYALQDQGFDTVEANLELGFPADARDYSAAATMLLGLGVRRVRLLTNNPDKVQALQRAGIEVVERVPLLQPPRPENVRYLRTKQERLGHLLGLS